MTNAEREEKLERLEELKEKRDELNRFLEENYDLSYCYDPIETKYCCEIDQLTEELFPSCIPWKPFEERDFLFKLSPFRMDYLSQMYEESHIARAEYLESEKCKKDTEAYKPGQPVEIKLPRWSLSSTEEKNG